MLPLRWGYVISAPLCRHSDHGSCHRWDPFFTDIFHLTDPRIFRSARSTAVCWNNGDYCLFGGVLWRSPWQYHRIWLSLCTSVMGFWTKKLPRMYLLLMWSSLVTPVVILSIFISAAVSLQPQLVYPRTFCTWSSIRTRTRVRAWRLLRRACLSISVAFSCRRKRYSFLATSSK